MTTPINRRPTPEPSRRWTPVERLPETPDAVIMTSTGYAIGGYHTRTVPPPLPRQPTSRPSFWQRLIHLTEKRN